DLKQGAGGIRAVEFIVQSLQLVFAGRNSALQGYSISKQIQQLVHAGKLSVDDGSCLNQAWLWLRKLENISQVVADQPTHQIPEDPAVKQVICDIFDGKDWSQMQMAIDNQRQQIENIFNQLFAEVENKQQLTDEQQLQLQNLMQGISSKRLPRKRQENIEQLLQNSLQIATESVVSNFLALVKKILTRPNYILMLLKETNVHQAVLNLMAKHPYFVAILQNYPVLLEQLFEREVFTPYTINNLTLGWQKQAPDDVEDWMEAMRYFKLEHQFNLILAWSEQQLSHQQTVQQMTELAVFILSEVVRYSHQEMIQKFDESGIAEDQLMVIAYGSAALKQMTVGSDLDLVFIVDSDQLSPDTHLFAQKWVRRIVHHLTTPMYHGKLYELDMRLRPNGNSGALATTKKEFAKYQTEQAWVWEHAAMVKSRAVFASDQQTQWHQSLRSEVLQQERDAKAVDQALLEMANKLDQMQQHKAHHAEFRILAEVLKNSHQFPQLTTHHHLIDIQAQLIELNLLDQKNTLSIDIKKDPAS
ncbi:Glutamate-ammonia-ligase adenylyltransferase, partial [hydrothermal vent metagenome]